MPPIKPTTVFFVDAHVAVRESLAALAVRRGMEVGGQVGSLCEANRLMARAADHTGLRQVLVTESSMPDGDGISLVRMVRLRSPEMGVVVLTMHDNDNLLLEALDAGASAFVSKRAGVAEVTAAIDGAASHPHRFSASGLADVMRRGGADAPLLTRREHEVLDHLVAGASAADTGARLNISTSTVKTHAGKVYGKLGVHNRAGLAMAAVRHGMVRTVCAATERPASA